MGHIVVKGLDLPHTGVPWNWIYGRKGGSIGTDGVITLTPSTFYSNHLSKTTTTITESFLYWTVRTGLLTIDSYILQILSISFEYNYLFRINLNLSVSCLPFPSISQQSCPPLHFVYSSNVPLVQLRSNPQYPKYFSRVKKFTPFPSTEDFECRTGLTRIHPGLF